MPVYTYICNSCSNEEQRLLSMKERTTLQTCSKCGEALEQKLPTNVESFSYEIRDPNRGKQLRKGIEKDLKARNRAHHDKYEIEEKIDKNGLDEARNQGWLRKLKKL